MKTALKLALLVVAALTLHVGRRPARAVSHGRTPSRWPRRGLFAGGSVALLAGLLLLAYGTYQMTHEEPERKPASNVAVLSFKDVGGGIYDRPLRVTPSPTPAPTPPPPPPPPLRDSPYRIHMPRIGVDSPVVTYGLDANNVPEVPYDSWDVAWYNFSAKPGTGGNAVFAGHVTWNGHAVFYNLDQMAAGDDIYLEATDGTKVLYKVSEVFLVDENDPNALSVMASNGSDVITVITCGGSPYYVGGIAGYDYTHRLVVRGSLAGVEPASAAGADHAPASGG
ncbi:MAG TPA: class F sortase [Dehalococcoidia bacterium]|nr:class F sortase [Dehalococcoidia bacterium]